MLLTFQKAKIDMNTSLGFKCLLTNDNSLCNQIMQQLDGADYKSDDLLRIAQISPLSIHIHTTCTKINSKTSKRGKSIYVFLQKNHLQLRLT